MSILSDNYLDRIGQLFRFSRYAEKNRRIGSGNAGPKHEGATESAASARRAHAAQGYRE